MHLRLCKSGTTVALTMCVLWPFTSRAQDQELAQVTVTATRRAESAQNVPIAVSAVTAGDLANSGVTEQIDLGQQIPGLDMTTNGTASAPFIRGIGSLDLASGRESSVATYVDGVYISSPDFNMFSFNNVDRVEVLKGPQGTLFGRNATGGLVQIITKTPKGNTDVYGSVSYGNYATTRASLYATTGFGEHLAADLAGVFINQGHGWGENVTTGSPYGRKKDVLMRSKWVYTPTDDTTVTAWFSYVDSHHDFDNGRQFLPGAVGVDGVTAYTGNWYNSTGNKDTTAVAIGRIGALQIDHDFDFAALKSITSYQRMKVFQTFDNDNTPLSIVDVEENESYKTLTQELQVLSSPHSPVKWIVGGFFMNDEAGFLGPIGLGLFGSGLPAGGVAIHNSTKTTSYAGFAEATLPIVEATNLTIGARYTRDKRHLLGFTDVFDSQVTRNVIAHIPVEPEPRATFSKPTFRAILDHRFNEEVMIYGGFSRGFKSGDFNNVAASDPPFNPEVLDSTEIGLKSDLFSRRLRLNASAFHYSYKDIQLGVFTGNSEQITNAASAHTNGGEIEGTAIVTDNLDLKFGVSYLDAKIGKFPNAVYFIPQAQGGDQQEIRDAGGNSLPRAPKYTFNISPTLKVPTPGGRLLLTGSYYYNDGFYWDYSNVRAQSGYHIVNASLDWSTADERFGVRLFGNNLTGAKYAIFVAPQALGDSFNPAAPMTFGLEAHFSLQSH